MTNDRIAHAAHRRALRRVAWLGMAALLVAIAAVGCAVILLAPAGA